MSRCSHSHTYDWWSTRTTSERWCRRYYYIKY